MTRASRFLSRARAPRTSRSRVLVASLVAATALPIAAIGSAQAQGTLVGRGTQSVGAGAEWVSLGDGVVQPGLVAGDSVVVRRAMQWSVPFALIYPFGDRVMVDLAGTYTGGEVTLGGGDAVLGQSTYELRGLSDLRLRATTHVVGDNVLFTLGATLPTGSTELDREELSALRVLAAPALGLQTPGVGLGPGGTAGLVLARQMGGWAWALAASYEIRGDYSPVAAFTAGVPAADYDPGDAVHLSLGTDGLLGQHAMTFTVSTDLYTEDELHFAGVAGSGVPPIATVRLGPVVGADWQLHVGTTAFRELTFYVSDRYRTNYELDGATVDGSSGNYLDAGMRSVRRLGRGTDLLAGLQFRHQTGLDVDRTLATAAAASGGLTLGLSRVMGVLIVQPYLRGQVGRVDIGGERVTLTGMGAGLAIGARF
ncbi:MAG: hypothetical protein ACYC2G_17760 [Gemmatimonadaceae bacterium]